MKPSVELLTAALNWNAVNGAAWVSAGPKTVWWWVCTEPVREERRERSNTWILESIEGPSVVDCFIFLCGLCPQDIQTTFLNIVPWNL